MAQTQAQGKENKAAPLKMAGYAGAKRATTPTAASSAKYASMTQLVQNKQTKKVGPVLTNEERRKAQKRLQGPKK